MAFLRLLLLGTLLGLVANLAVAQSTKPNVLLILVDDLRPELGCYDHPLVQSPNIDRLARRGTVFTRAYCQYALCAPSRASLLTGLRPNSTRIFGIDTTLRAHLPTETTLPQAFRQAGYETITLGKIYHFDHDDAANWSRMPLLNRLSLQDYSGYVDARYQVRRRTAEAKKLSIGEVYKQSRISAVEALDVPDTAYADGIIANEAVRQLRQLGTRGAGSQAPFFMAVGMVRPHIPFTAPKRYWDQYDPRQINVPDSARTQGAPALAFANFPDLRNYPEVPKKGVVPPDVARLLIHGYYASVSYMDAQVGKVLDELERQGLAQNTIVVLAGDHGWKLGERGNWDKHGNFELDLRVPLIVYRPRQRPGSSPALVELVDLFPTLTDLCALPAVAQREGVSVAPLLKKPALRWKRAAFSQYQRRGNVMGYTLTDGQWRYTEWQQPDGAVVAKELYDHRQSPVSTQNLSGQPALSTTETRLSDWLRAGWQRALPTAR
jgi:iduronate 2-sulfatase